MNDIKDQITKYSRSGKYHDLIDLLEQQIDESKNVEEKYFLKLKLAESYYSIREFSKAKSIGEKLLPLVKEKADLILIGEVENLLGKIYRIHQRYNEALIHYNNAKKSFKLANHNVGLAKIYHNIGNVYIFLGHFKNSLKNHRKALDLAIEEEDEEAIASSYLNIGSIYYQDGSIDEALDYFSKAKDLYVKLGNEPSLAAIHLNLAEVNLLRRDFKSARKNSIISKDLYSKQQNEIGLKLALTVLGKAEKSLGLFNEAIDTFRNLINIDPNNIKDDIFFELGECYIKTNQQIKAKETFEKILELPKRTPQSTGYSLDFLARLALEMNNLNEARQLYTQLLAFLNSMDPQDNDSIVSTQANFGFVLLKTGEFEEAWKLLETCTNYFRKKKNLEDLITLTNNYRDYLISIDDYKHSISIIENFIIPAVKKLSKEKFQIYRINYEVALLYSMIGKNGEALKYWKKSKPKNILFQKLNPTFLESMIISEIKKEELKKQHLSFIKMIRDNDEI
ncbi:MAG: tetratricopeptide repeat protein [Candidatus Hodarchaeota archaeon]